MSWTEQDRPWRAAPPAAGPGAADDGAARAESAAAAARRAAETLERSRQEREARARREADLRAAEIRRAEAEAEEIRRRARPAATEAASLAPSLAPAQDAALPAAGDGGFDPATLSRGAADPLPDDAPLAGGETAAPPGAGVDAALRAETDPAAKGARLTEVIDQRARGLDPNAEAARRRAETAAAGARALRRRARWRMSLLGVAFVMAYGAVAGSMATLASEDPREPRAYDGSAGPIDAVRAEIHDVNGRVLAANLPVHSLFVRRNKLLDPENALRGLMRVFPDKDPEELARKLTEGHNFQWIERAVTPEQRIAVLDIGEPGLGFGPRERRFYPQGRLASHILGGAKYGEEGELAAEIIGDGGVESWFDDRLRDAAMVDQPLRLSIDIRVQAALEDVLAEAKETYFAKGVTGVIMRARTGEILGMASLPDFDPNRRSEFFDINDAPDVSPLFNRAVQGRYELGSVYKPFTAAMVMDNGMASPLSMIDTKGPLVVGGRRIRDFHRMPDQMDLREVIVQSSNIGTAGWAMRAGAEKQKEFLSRFGLLDRVPVELPEAATAKPLFPDRWREVHTATISYGHGISGTPVNLAAAYAALVNGGIKVEPTLIAGAQPPGEEARIIKPMTSVWVRDMLRAVVTERRGTAKRADAAGYEVGGKTGTADKPDGKGGYFRKKVIATFASAFPIHDPELVIVVTFDEAEDRSGTYPRRTAGLTAAPTVRALVERIAPILGMRPTPEPGPEAGPPGWVATGLARP